MKAAFIVLALLVLVSACATTNESNSFDPQVQYGGSYRVRGMVSSGVQGK
ncbi:MAG: hypothetical protein AAGU11_11140 [Syntrophobacteraceae bacterium]